MNTEKDSELVVLARNGDKEAFGYLIERYQQMATQIALHMLEHKQTEVARELVQEAMLQAYLSLKYLREDALFKSWLYGIVLNV